MATDIDIDFADRHAALVDLPHVAAVEKAKRKRHQSGVYFQDIPTDPLDHMAVWDYERAADAGFLKVDFLTNNVYRDVRDEEHLIELLVRDPPWEAFEVPEIVQTLIHIGNHWAVVNQIKPRSVVDLAICLALVRPGKRHLIGRTRTEIDQEIWQPCDGGYFFKKSHAIAYASAIVVQLNLLVEQGDGLSAPA